MVDKTGRLHKFFLVKVSSGLDWLVMKLSVLFSYADVPMPVELTDVPSFVNSREITLKWKKPNDNGAPITGYVVYQRILSQDGEKSSWKLVGQTSDCKYRIRLERGQKLDFIITAENKCGESLKNEENTKRVEVSGMFALVTPLCYFFNK